MSFFEMHLHTLYINSSFVFLQLLENTGMQYLYATTGGHFGTTNKIKQQMKLIFQKGDT